MVHKFKPAKPSKLALWLAQSKIKGDLERDNKVLVSDEDLAKLRALPGGGKAGIILTPNHADECDPRVCIDLSRRINRRFIFMCNREAFSEYGGLAGLGLQSIGYYSIERGGRDLPAKDYSVNVVHEGKDILVIFPEGEIFYLNQTLQPFHSGAIDIAMQALIKKRASEPDWTAYLVPLALRYSYAESIENILDARIAEMEAKLKEDTETFTRDLTRAQKLSRIQADLIEKEEKAHNLPAFQDQSAESSGESEDEGARLARLSARIIQARRALLQQVEGKTTAVFNANAKSIDQAWQVSAHLREKLEGGQLKEKLDKAKKAEIKEELEALAEVAQLASWSPEYVGADPTSPERMAEMVLKLERELYRIKRPKQLARRHVHLRVGTPIDLAPFIKEYQSEPHKLRHKLATQLRDEIQNLINSAVP